MRWALLKPDWHSWWISKMRSDNLEERYAEKFCFKLGKNVRETYGMFQTAFGASCMNQASVFDWHKILKKGRESVRVEEICGRSNEVNTPELIGKGLGLRLICRGFKGVQEEIPSEEASTLHIGSVAFPPGQCTSPQLHPCHRIFDKDGHQGYVSGCDEGYWHTHNRGLPWSVPEVVGTVQQVHCSRRRLLRRGLESHVCTINKSTYTKKVWRCPWCSRYRRRKWTRRYEFKSWTRPIAFHIALIPLGKVWIQLLSLQLWVNSRTD